MSITVREPVLTRQKTLEQSERRNSVSDITEFFQSKTPKSTMPPPINQRKTSGKNRDKENQKEIREIKENIKQYLNSSDENYQMITNGGKPKECEKGNHADCNSPAVQSLNYDEECILNENQTTTRATQTTEDEMLKAIRELAAKYQKVDDDLNDPKNGISAILSKTNEKVTQIYSDIHGAAEGLEVRFKKMEELANNNLTKITQIESSQTRMASLLGENRRLIQELKLMQGIVQKVVQKTDNQAMQIMDLTKRGMEQNLILYGVDDTLEVQDPREETPMFSFRERPRQSCLKFFKDEMNIGLDTNDIWKAHRVGPYKPEKVRPMVIKVSYAAKELILEHLTTLKGRTNPKTKQTYFISEQIPEGVMEIRKQTSARAKVLKDIEEKKPKESRNKIQIQNDKVLVNGEIQALEVEPPQPAQLFLDTESQKRVDEIQKRMVETDVEILKNSEFVGVAVKVHSVQEVRQAYVAVAQRHPTVDHIILGYALKEEGKLKVGFCDDKEYGAGSRVKDTIFEGKARNTAVFILRKFGGLHLGYGRFEVIQRVARKAIELLNQ